MRRARLSCLSYPLGITAAGDRRYLSPSLVGSLEAAGARVVEGAVARGGVALATLCRDIAARVAGDDDHRDVIAIRIVTGVHDAVEFLVRDRLGRELERALPGGTVTAALVHRRAGRGPRRCAC